MNLLHFNPSLASSALSAFRPHLESGQMSVPFFVATETDGLNVLSKAMTLENLTEATLNLVALARFTGSPAEPWGREIFSTPNRQHFSNPETGQAVHLEINSSLARNLTGSAHGVAVSCRRFGDFGGTAMTIGFDPTSKRPSLHIHYDIELTEAGLLGLRGLLGWEEDLPIYELSLRLFHRLKLEGDDHPRNPYADLGQISLQNEWFGTEPDGAFVTILGGLDDALSEAYGDIIERFRLEVSPADDCPALPESLRSIWSFADEVATASNAKHRNDAILTDRAAYKSWVMRVYGSESLPPASRGKT